MTLAVSTTGVSKRYGSVRALDALDLQVEEGSLFGLLGPNGAGKSTAFGIMCGWLKADAGESLVLGVASQRAHLLGGRVAALPQDATFPPQISIRDQLCHFGRLNGMTGSKARREADRVLELVGLEDKRKAKGRELSHGMSKRAGLAQALLGSPSLIFLDEPTAGLDPKNARAIKDLMAELVPRTTVIVSSHNLAEVQEICTHAAILDHGKTQYNGRVEELTRTRGELVFELGPGPLPSVETLQERLNVTARLSPGLLEVSYSDERDSADVIRGTIEQLFSQDVPLLGVRRGISLEGAFLELTGNGPQAPEDS
ncbi:MAG: ABC transporter ATP-binding protein [Myxococcota bacterium]